MSEIGRKIDRPELSKSSDTGKPVSTPSFQANFPTLWDFLSKQRDYGEIHKTGCVTLFVDGEKIKLCANDRPSRQSCFISADGLLQALARLDRGLLEGSLQWSSANYRRRSRAKVYRQTPCVDP